jgi:trans-2,3-dihydro-3-hydroxyanthranilate isomerase
VPTFRYVVADVFTDVPLAGNQLAVFTDARGLDTARMQRLACEMNFSESTFILPSEQPGTDVRMRIFTPHLEMPMAGHPTIGSTFALAHAGVIRPGAARFVFGLNVGPTPVDLEWHNDALAFAWMTQLPPKFSPPLEARVQAAAALGLQLTDLVPDLPVQEITCGVSYLMVPLRDRTTVDRAVADLTALKTLLTGDSAVFLFSVDSGSSGQSVYSRMFAPDLGVTEDPATGSASGPLGCYLVKHGLVPADKAGAIVSSQGVKMGRPSRIHIKIDLTGGEISRVRVGGTSVLVGEGRLRAS